jgi:predicted RND superfamily exporter protein
MNELESTESDSKKKVYKEKKFEIEYASATERFLGEVMAPELLSKQGRIGVLFVWFIMCLCASYGASQVRIDFKVDYFIPPDSYTY